jgi:hypothetical protein
MVALDEDVCLENTARRCILDPVCVCVCVRVCLVLYHILCMHKEIDANEVTDNINRKRENRKRETKRRRVYVYVRACAREHSCSLSLSFSHTLTRAHLHTNTLTHNSYIHITTCITQFASLSFDIL